MQGFEGEEGMAFHPIISEIKDVDDDGKPDIFRLRSEHPGAQIERLRYDDGSVVWESDPVGPFHGDESRLAVFELEGPSDGCVFYADKGGVYCFDAATGITRWQQKGGGGDFTVGRFLHKDKSAMAIHANGVIPSRRTWRDPGGGSWSHAMPGGHEGIRRQIDLDGNGRADVIMPFGAWHWGSDAILFLMETPASMR